MVAAREVNFDGMIGPSHMFAGLAPGNLAAESSQGAVSHPKAAALQGLKKMKKLHDLGVVQGIFPPHTRPALEIFRELGVTGTDAEILGTAARDLPELLIRSYSASSMWAANSATVSPSCDAADGRVHFTPANQVTHLHRTIEAAQTAAVLRAIFPDEAVFAHHAPLPRAGTLGDEGAANHCRLCPEYGASGVHLFVFGRDGLKTGLGPAKNPARQTRVACALLAWQHRLDPQHVVFAQQNPEAIDAGVFHNDVIATADRDVFFYHELAYVDTPRVVAELSDKYSKLHGKPLRTVEVRASELGLDKIVESYLFNSQIVRDRGGKTVLVAPEECRTSPRVQQYLDELLGRHGCPFGRPEFVDLKESMMNGGGPACLRLRVVLTDEQLAGVHSGVLLTDSLYDRLVEYVTKNYPDPIGESNLKDPAFAERCREIVAGIRELLGVRF
jgi:succinylarginine dihydrolase